MAALKALQEVNKLVEEESKGDSSAHAKLLKSIRNLQLAVETPLETTSRLNFQILQNICSRIALEKGLYAQIVSRGGSPITAQELANGSGADVLLIGRVMRVLTAIGFVQEVDEETYAANDVTRFKATDGAIGAEKHHFDNDMAMGGKLVPYMRGPGISQFADNGNEITLFQYALGTPTIFGFLEKTPEQKQSFDAYMASKRPSYQQQWFEIYPAREKLQNARSGLGSVLMVDVGGGPGQELIGFQKANPDIPGRLILQDLRITLDRIQEIPEGIEKMEYDFFTPQPIKGARAYFLRDVLHNWSDAKSAKILEKIAEAMDTEYSTLLIDDYVIPPTGADLRAAEMDILMWLHTAGIERTVTQWERLLNAAGLEIVQIWPSTMGSESVIEIKKRAA